MVGRESRAVDVDGLPGGDIDDQRAEGRPGERTGGASGRGRRRPRRWRPRRSSPAHVTRATHVARTRRACRCACTRPLMTTPHSTSSSMSGGSVDRCVHGLLLLRWGLSRSWVARHFTGDGWSADQVEGRGGQGIARPCVACPGGLDGVLPFLPDRAWRGMVPWQLKVPLRCSHGGAQHGARPLRALQPAQVRHGDRGTGCEIGAGVVTGVRLHPDAGVNAIWGAAGAGGSTRDGRHGEGGGAREQGGGIGGGDRRRPGGDAGGQALRARRVRDRGRARSDEDHVTASVRSWVLRSE